MKYITYWNPDHTVSRIILREDAPELGNEPVREFVARRFGGEVCAINPELRSIVELDGRPDQDEFHTNMLGNDLMGVSGSQPMPPDAFVWLLVQNVPPSAFRDPQVRRNLMVLHHHLQHWDIHTTTMRRFTDDVYSNVLRLPVGLLVFTKDVWEKSRNRSKPFNEENCLAAEKPLCHHLNKLLAGVRCRVIEVAHETVGVSEPGLTVLEALSEIESSGSTAVLAPEDFIEERTESGEVRWRLSPDLWATVAHLPAGDGVPESGWGAWLFRSIDGRVETRAETEILPTREAAVAEATRRWPGVRMPGDEAEEKRICMEACRAVRTGIPVLDGWLWKDGAPKLAKISTPDELAED